jgi:diacylglycerol kinase
MKQGVRGQSSFFVHFFVAAAVLATAAVLHVSRAEWCMLILCITIVMAAEMFNSSLESMARAITDEWSPHLRNALDIASTAVLVAAIGASVVGAIILGSRVFDL